MKRKFFLLAVIMAIPFMAHAQWKIGVTVGADYNHYSINKQYLYDYSYKGRWGMTVGVMGQYNFTDWFGLRADLNWIQKNRRVSRELIPEDVKYYNNYLQLPVMASFSFGGSKLRGFCNVGVYGGYWMGSRMSGVVYNNFTRRSYSVAQKVDFNNDRDKRWDCGLVGGLGLEYKFANHWGAQVELRYYYSTTSVQKQYTRLKDYRYNSTLALQAGVCYYF